MLVFTKMLRMTGWHVAVQMSRWDAPIVFHVYRLFLWLIILHIDYFLPRGIVLAVRRDGCPNCSTHCTSNNRTFATADL